MKQIHNPGFLRVAIIGLWVGAALLFFSAAVPTAHAFIKDIHERVTLEGLPFIKADVLEAIVSGNLDEDEGKEASFDERHAQGCRFRDHAAYVNKRYRQIVHALHAPPTDDPDRAARYFGHLLHGLQDFYSHSNWIPRPPEGLGLRNRILDSGLGAWPLPTPYAPLLDDIVVVEGNPPAGVTVRLPSNAASRITSAVPVVVDQQSGGGGQPRRYRGLMTSGVGSAPGYVGVNYYDSHQHHCPPVEESCDVSTPENVCLRHGAGRSADTTSRNFDGKGRMNLDEWGEGDWREARRHATMQIQHEWCRLLHLSRDWDPTYIASSRLLGTWVAASDEGAGPHAPGTPCERQASRRNRVEVTVAPVEGTLIPLSFVVFRTDFTDSRRASLLLSQLFHRSTTLSLCANDNDEIVASLIPRMTQGVTRSFRVGDIGQGLRVRDHRGPLHAEFEIEVTRNGCNLEVQPEIPETGTTIWR